VYATGKNNRYFQCNENCRNRPSASNDNPHKVFDVKMQQLF